MASTDLAVPDENGSVTLFHTDDPLEVLHRATPLAKELAKLVRKQNLIVRIGQSDHVRVEGWTLLGSMLGVFPIVEWTRPVLDAEGKREGWEARVVARTRAGETVGAGEAECLRSEKAWSFAPVNRYGKPLEARDDYALRSMAQTRAVSKALRLPLGFVMQLAGFDPTPADEMPGVIEHRAGEPQAGEEGGSPPPVSQRAEAAAEPASPASKPTKPTPEQIKFLNFAVGTLRGAGRLETDWLWDALGRHDEMLADGVDSAMVSHWSPLRERITRDEASKLYELLKPMLDDPNAVWAAGSSTTREPQAEAESILPSSADVSQAVLGEPASRGLSMTELKRNVADFGVSAEAGQEVMARLFPGRQTSDLTDEERLKVWLELQPLKASVGGD